MTFNNLTFTSGFTGTFGNVTRSIFGSLTLNSAINSFSSGASTLTFNGTGSQTITTANETIDCPITFDNAAGTWALQDALTLGSTRTCTLTTGTLNLNNYTLTTGVFSSSNSNTRVLAFGTGKIVVTGTNASVYNTSVATGLTITGSRTVEFTGVGTGGQIRTITGGVTTTGGTAATAVDCYIQAGADAIDFGTANRTYRTINFTGFGSGAIAANTRPNIYGDLVLSSGGMTLNASTNTWAFRATTVQTITTAGLTFDFPVTFDGIGGVWAMQDALTLGSTQPLTFTNGTLQLKSGTTNTVGSFVTTGTNVKYLQATTPGSQATISDASGTDAVTYLHITDSNATGGAVWNATSTTNTNGGNNTGWLFTTLPTSGFFAFF